jgi:2-methylcitrate dehydratase PrpD
MDMVENEAPAIAEEVAGWLCSLEAKALPAGVVEMSRKLVLDVAGLSIAARREDYIAATLAAVDRPSGDRPSGDRAPGDQQGACTALGHAGAYDAFGAALVNGTAAHGEDYDDTFEGGPVHSGAVILPAVVAACEREALGGERLLIGIAGGVELMCRLSLVAPKAIHEAGFHPTAVLGAVAAAGGVGAALGLSRPQLVNALGIAGSMASGIIEYLAEGSWTKRMHAGWAAQSGIRAALMARGGFTGPRTLFEGEHGLFHGFAPSRRPDFKPVRNLPGGGWVIETIAFKPYACGTMTQPFIDCAIRLAETGVPASEIEDILCEVGDGTVPRLWEPLAVKHNPPTPYAAKFSTPFCIALGFLERKAGLAQFTAAKIADPALRGFAAKVRYVVNPKDEYPKNFTGHLKARLKSGRVLEFRQPHMRGGAHAPLSDAEIAAKFRDNALHGGWTAAKAAELEALSRRLFTLPTLQALQAFRG